MIITLILIGIFICGLVLWILSNCKRIDWTIRDIFSFVGSITTLVGGIIMLVTLCTVLSNVITCDIYYQNKLYEKEMLEYRIEQMDENITGNEMLYNDIVNFNNELRETKKWAKNPWTSWFNNQKIATIDYVELDGH